MATGFLHTGFRTKISSASGAIATNAIVAQDGITGVAQSYIASGGDGWMGVSGVWNLPVPVGTVRGSALYLPGSPVTNTNAGTLTLTGTGNTMFGVAETDRDSDGNAQIRVANSADQAAASSGVQSISLGAPALASTNYYVTSTNEKVGAFTVLNSGTPDVPRNVTVTATAAGGADTQGTVTIDGTDASGAVITEDIIPNPGSTVAGLLAFATVTAASQAGWVISAGNDTLVIGTGNLLGLPVILDPSSVFQAYLGETATASNATSDMTLAGTTVDLSASTYDGTKIARVLHT